MEKITLNVPQMSEIKTRVVIPNAGRWATKSVPSKKAYNRKRDRRIDS
jgi:hypothetical protein